MAKEPKWLTAARKEVGTKEGPGPANSKTVLNYYVEASHPEIHTDDVAWCAAFVNAMLKRGDVKGNGSLSARSFESWGQPCPNNNPVLGCVGVKKRAGSSWQGHVGFVVGANKTTIFLLAGNQGDKVSIASFPRNEFTAFRWPANIPIATNTLPTTIADAGKNVSQA
jgi:uncharacterized protein (TIGR02594 family)